ncbi:MAG: hypothetical protein K8T10_10720 [Candidatus Eremiobacteraeota bacterium]|nr:hypothetical protein [Candidatus Eremiobacteraeota bacterium]
MHLLKHPIILIGISILLGVCGQFLFKSGLNKMTGSKPIILADIKDFASLAGKIESPGNSFSQYLKENLSPQTNELLDNYDNSGKPSEELQKSLIDDLNKLIHGSCIYDEKRFSNVTLERRTQRLLAKNPSGKELVQLNKYLLVDAYKGELLPGSIELTPRIVLIFFTPYIAAGLFCYVLSTFTWLSGLSRVPLSFAYPLLSMGYLIIFTVGVVFLDEKYTHMKLVANLLIIAGICLLFYREQ